MLNSHFARRSVIAFLFSSDLQKMRDFTFRGFGFSAKSFPALANFITTGLIGVQYDGTLKGQGAYDYKKNLICVNFTDPDNLTTKALLVHECTHALQDLAKAKIDVQTSESIAYITQCMYARLNAKGAGRLRNTNDFSRDEVFRIGWDIAGKILGGGSVGTSDQSSLIAAVAKHPFYSNICTASAGYEGV